MKKEVFENLEIFCPDETCGDPLPSNDGVIRYIKRRLIFTGFKDLDRGVYVVNATRAYYLCPVCGHTRAFKRDNERVVETKP